MDDLNLISECMMKLSNDVLLKIISTGTDEYTSLEITLAKAELKKRASAGNTPVDSNEMKYKVSIFSRKMTVATDRFYEYFPWDSLCIRSSYENEKLICLETGRKILNLVLYLNNIKDMELSNEINDIIKQKINTDNVVSELKPLKLVQKAIAGTTIFVLVAALVIAIIIIDSSAYSYIERTTKKSQSELNPDPGKYDPFCKDGQIQWSMLVFIKGYSRNMYSKCYVCGKSLYEAVPYAFNSYCIYHGLIFQLSILPHITVWPMRR